LQTYIPHRYDYFCDEAFVTYVKRDELIKAGSVVSNIFFPMNPFQRSAEFEIYGCLHKHAK